MVKMKDCSILWMAHSGWSHVEVGQSRFVGASLDGVAGRRRGAVPIYAEDSALGRPVGVG